jgi:hypothetical protein
VLLADEMEAELVLDVDDDAVQLVNVLLETVKLLLLKVVSPVTIVNVKKLLPPLALQA